MTSGAVKAELLDREDLTPKQALFVENYVIDFNATKAALRAGYSAKTAAAIGNENLTKPAIRSALAKRINKNAKKVSLEGDFVLDRLMSIAAFDIREAVSFRSNVIAMVENEDGDIAPGIVNQVELIDSDKLTDKAAYNIKGIKQGKDGSLSLQFEDKQGALEKLGRHLGLFKDRMELTGKNGRALMPVKDNLSVREVARLMAMTLMAGADDGE